MPARSIPSAPRGTSRRRATHRRHLEIDPLLFIYTNSYDLTADVLIRRIGNVGVFRFNLDLWRDYRIEINEDRFRVTNPTGRTIESKDITKFLWRKPLTNPQLYPDRTFPRAQVFQEEELAYAMREVWNAMYYNGKAILIDPLSDTMAGKLLQAQIARKYFSVPEWTVRSGFTAGEELGAKKVAKSLTSMRPADRSMLFTTPIDIGELSPQAPWFLQSFVAATEDVTVVFVRGSIFTFALSRGDFPAGVVDWRRARVLMQKQKWSAHALPDDVEESIRRFMADMCLHYGRLDFLLADGKYSFLEVNPDGEWGWLDQSGEAGVLEAFAIEVSPDTPCHPLPNPRAIGTHGRLRW